MDGHLKRRVMLVKEEGRPMPENTSYTPRRWQRQPSKIPISLVLETDPFKADDSAITVDISRRGASVLTNAGAVSRRVVGSRRQWGNLAGRRCSRGLGAGGGVKSLELCGA
jgi:hypothetical protein